MRCDQYVGLTKKARIFLRENRREPDKCECCGQYKPLQDSEVYDKYFGMFDQEYGLSRYTLKDGRTAEEVLQASPWSSGPMFFLLLRVSDGQVFKWEDKEIDTEVYGGPVDEEPEPEQTE